MLDWSDDLRVMGTGLHLDSRVPRPLCFVSHAHSDHTALHECALALPATAALCNHRLGTAPFTELEYYQDFQLDADTIVRPLPAGHVLGSAMLHVTRPEGTLLYS